MEVLARAARRDVQVHVVGPGGIALRDSGGGVQRTLPGAPGVLRRRHRVPPPHRLARRRVAAEIHDGVTQQLVSVWYRLQAIGRSLRAEPDRAEQELSAARDLVDEALAEARTAIYDLRPSVLDDLGLSASLRTLAVRQLEGEVDLELAI